MNGEQAEFLAAVQARIERIEVMRNLSLPIEPAATEEIRELTGLLTAITQEAVSSADRDVITLAAGVWAGVVRATAVDDPDLPWRLSNLGAVLTAQFETSHASADLDEAIVALQTAADGSPDDAPYRAAIFANLGNALQRRFDETGQLTDLDAAVTALRVASHSSPAGDPQREELLTWLAGTLLHRYERTGMLTDLDAIISTLQAAATAEDGSGRIQTFDNLGRALHARFVRTRARTDLDAAVEAFQAAAAAARADDPDCATILANLGAALGDRFAQTAVRADLDAAIEALREAANLTPAGHPGHPDRLANLATALTSRFDRTGELDQLRSALRLLETAAAAAAGQLSHAAIASKLDVVRRRHDELMRLHDEEVAASAELDALLGIPDVTAEKRQLEGSLDELNAAIARYQAEVGSTSRRDRNLPVLLAGVAYGLGNRYRLTRNPADLDAAIEAMREWLAVAPSRSPFRPGQVLVLAHALTDRYWLGGARADLDAAIAKWQEAVASIGAFPIPSDQVTLVTTTCLTALGKCLQARFRHSGALADIDAAISAFQQAADITPPDYLAGCLSGLGEALEGRFEYTGNMADLDAAISATGSAVEMTPAADPDGGMRLSNRGLARWRLAQHTGNMADLDAAIADLQAARAAEPGDQVCVARLGYALLDRFDRTGVPADLDAAIEVSQSAAGVGSGVDRHYAAGLALLGHALLRRFEEAGNTGDFSASLEAFRAAVAATPDGHRDQVRFTANMAGAQMAGYRHLGRPERIDTVIAALRATVAATPPGDPQRPVQLNNLGNALQARFEHHGDKADLDSAVDALRTAVDVTSTGNPLRTEYLGSMGSALVARFRQTGEAADLDAAIAALRAAAEGTPADHPRRARHLTGLGAALRARFENTADDGAFEAAVSAFSAAADQRTASAGERISAAAAAAAMLAGPVPQRASALYRAAMELLPELSLRPLNRRDQQQRLGLVAGLATEAAAAALADTTHPREPERALLLLETGRAVLFSQVLDMRDDLLSALRTRHPDVAQRFTRLRDRLDRSENPISADTGISMWQHMRTVADRRQLTVELAATVAEIRALDGFGSFGKPPPVEELLAEAADGPIAIFNVASNRSDALLVTAEGVRCLPLPALRRDVVIDRIASFRAAVHRASERDVALPERVGGQRTLLDILGWLWDAAASPVLDALGFVRAPAPGEPWPRVWWAPGGMLGLLPLHAAGHHSEPDDSRTVLDRVVSSYTPTIRALRYAREHAKLPVPPDMPALIVAMLATAAEGGLPNAAAEVDQLVGLLPAHVLLTEPRVPGAAGVPVKAAVLARLPQCAIAHFACHGITDLDNPSQSRLVLSDHDTDPLTVTSLAPVSLEHARLAYLSACGTALSTPGMLLDEAIHLTSAFQLAGFPHVVGTMWDIDDALAVQVAGRFYAGLTTSAGTLDVGRSASALHGAVRALRESHRATPSLWAAYIHAGA
jgi:hypothetical protein